MWQRAAGAMPPAGPGQAERLNLPPPLLRFFMRIPATTKKARKRTKPTPRPMKKEPRLLPLPPCGAGAAAGSDSAPASAAGWSAGTGASVAKVGPPAGWVAVGGVVAAGAAGVATGVAAVIAMGLLPKDKNLVSAGLLLCILALGKRRGRAKKRA